MIDCHKPIRDSFLALSGSARPTLRDFSTIEMDTLAPIKDVLVSNYVRWVEWVVFQVLFKY